MFNLIKSAIRITILSIVFLFSTYAVIAAWSEPAGGPTGNNAATPLDVSSTGQTKIGGLILNTGAAANGLIVSAGNVGIGTTNPGMVLDISAPSAIQRITSSTGTNPAYLQFANTSGVAGAVGNGYIGVEGSVAGTLMTGDSIYAMAIQPPYLRNLQFGYGNGGTAMTILSGGNVGIGTTNPAQKLSVAGVIESTTGGVKFPDGTTQTTAGGGSVAVPTRQVLTSGSGTYTTPATTRQLRIRMVGGGGGGGASYTNAGSNGTASSFNSITANPGSGGKGWGTLGGFGGLGGSGGSGTASLRIAGGGGGGNNYAGYTVTGTGGNSAFGGGGPPASAQTTPGASNQGAPNSGGGGSGGSDNTAGGAGGGAGEYVELIINNPATTYSYSVGTGGAGGVAGSYYAGAAGGSGVIIVDEIY